MKRHSRVSEDISGKYRELILTLFFCTIYTAQRITGAEVEELSEEIYAGQMGELLLPWLW